MTHEIELTKWPRLLVMGLPVTREQTNEIIFRTTDWAFQRCNLRDWQLIAQQALTEITDAPDFSRYDREAMAQWEGKYDILPVNYLVNRRVMSSWFGGAHGWCNWDGQIFAADYNIGKWPLVSEVEDEWRVIAAAFPYLKLRAQLLPDEGDSEAAVEFFVEAGEVRTTTENVETLQLRRRTVEELYRSGPVRDRAHERGVSLDRLREVLEQARERCR
jgi:hypothetical protein